MIPLILAAAMALNPAVTLTNLQATVCTANWTATIRPPASFTDRLKRQQLPNGAKLAAYEEDHVMPLCLGGAPRDPGNLRPQRWPAAHRKDREEKALCRAVCTGKLTLDAARAKMASDWP